MDVEGSEKGVGTSRLLLLIVNAHVWPEKVKSVHNTNDKDGMFDLKLITW
jgi:hypothetical protein